MAKTRVPLQLDDITEGDLIEVRCHDGARFAGYYGGLKRWPLTRFWSVMLLGRESAETGGEEPFHVGSLTVRQWRILKPVVRREQAETDRPW